MITPAYAQAAGGVSSDTLIQLVPFIAVFAIMYFLMIRPTQQKAKQHQEMVKNLRRGDTVITSGGLIGKVTKLVDDDQVEVEIADGVRVRQVRTWSRMCAPRASPSRTKRAWPAEPVGAGRKSQKWWRFAKARRIG